MSSPSVNLLRLSGCVCAHGKVGQMASKVCSSALGAYVFKY